jgi:hypothetical protein
VTAVTAVEPQRAGDLDKLPRGALDALLGVHGDGHKRRDGDKDYLRGFSKAEPDRNDRDPGDLPRKTCAPRTSGPGS